MDELDDILALYRQDPVKRTLAPKENDKQFRDFFTQKGFKVNRTFGKAINKGSLHPYGLAADIDFNGKSDDEIGDLVESALQKGYRVFDERVKQPGVKQTGPHLHFERNNGNKPSSFLQGRYGKKDFKYLTDLDNARLGKGSAPKQGESLDDLLSLYTTPEVPAQTETLDDIIGLYAKPSPTNPVNPPKVNIPAPEAPETINAQIQSTLDPNSPKKGTLITPGEQIPTLGGLQVIDVPEGKLAVNPAKGRPRSLAEAIGKVQDVGNNTRGMTVYTTDAQGNELSASIVRDPKAAAEQVKLDKQMYPQAVNHELLPSEEVARRRAEITRNPFQSPDARQFPWSMMLPNEMPETQESIRDKREWEKWGPVYRQFLVDEKLEDSPEALKRFNTKMQALSATQREKTRKVARKSNLDAQVGSEEKTYKFDETGVLALENGKKLFVDNSKEVPVNTTRFRDDEGETYLFDRTTGKLQDESLSDIADTFPVSRVPYTQKATTPLRQAQEHRAVQVARALATKYGMNEDDVYQWVMQRGFTDPEASKAQGRDVPLPEDRYYESDAQGLIRNQTNYNRQGSSIGAPGTKPPTGEISSSDTHSLTRRQMRELEAFTSEQKAKREQAVLKMISEGREPDAETLRSLGVSLDELRSKQYDEFEMARVKGRVNQADIDRFKAEYRSQGNDERLAELKALQRKGIGGKEVSTEIANYENRRREIAEEVRKYGGLFKEGGYAEKKYGYAPQTQTPEDIDRKVNAQIAKEIQAYGSITAFVNKQKKAEAEERARIERIKNDPTSKKVFEYVKGYSAGVAGSAVEGIGDFVKGFPIWTKPAVDYIDSLFGTNHRDLKNHPFTQLGQGIKDAGQFIKDWQSRDYQKEFWAGSVPQGLGSSIAFMPAAAGGPLGISLFATMQMTGSSYDEAIEAGAKPETAEKYGQLVGGLLGWTERFGLGESWQRLIKGQGGKRIKGILLDALKESAEEVFVNELPQSLGQNYLAKLTFDPARQWDKDLADHLGAAGVSAPVASILISGLLHIKHRRQIAQVVKDDMVNGGPLVRDFGEGGVFVSGKQIQVTKELEPLLQKHREYQKEIQTGFDDIKEAKKRKEAAKFNDKPRYDRIIDDIRREQFRVMLEQQKVAGAIARLSGSVPSIVEQKESAEKQTQTQRITLKPLNETKAPTPQKPAPVDTKALVQDQPPSGDAPLVSSAPVPAPKARTGTNANGSTWTEVVKTKDDGSTKTTYDTFRPDGKKVTVGRRQFTKDELLKEFPLLPEYREDFEEYIEKYGDKILVREIREAADGRGGITLTVGGKEKGIDHTLELAFDRNQKPSAPVSETTQAPGGTSTAQPNAAEPKSVESLLKYYEEAPTDLIPEAPLRPSEKGFEIVSETGAKATTPVGQLKEQRDEERRKGNTDKLTGLANQNAWETAKERVEADPEQEVISIDVNRMKDVNDTTSHENVNKTVLKPIGDAVQKVLEKHGIDSRNGFRTGGDEFTVAVPKGKAQQVRDDIEKAFGTVNVTAEKDFTNDRTGESFKKGDIIPVTISGSFGNTVKEAEVELGKRKEESKKANPVNRDTNRDKMSQSVKGDIKTEEVSQAPSAGTKSVPETPVSQKSGQEDIRDKQPWEMTKAEWENLTDKQRDSIHGTFRHNEANPSHSNYHLIRVGGAIAQGERVPLPVLEDFQRNAPDASRNRAEKVLEDIYLRGGRFPSTTVKWATSRFSKERLNAIRLDAEKEHQRLRDSGVEPSSVYPNLAPKKSAKQRMAEKVTQESTKDTLQAESKPQTETQPKGFEATYGIPAETVGTELERLKGATPHKRGNGVIGMAYRLVGGEVEIDQENLGDLAKSFVESYVGKRVARLDVEGEIVPVIPDKNAPKAKPGRRSVETVTTQEQSRFALNRYIGEKGLVVATDGHQLVLLKDPSQKERQWYDSTTGEVIPQDEVGGAFPNYEMVAPKEETLSKSQPIDTQALINVAKRTIDISKNLDRRDPVPLKLKVGGEEYAFNPQYIYNGLRILQANGKNDVTVGLNEEYANGAFVFENDAGKYVVMPLRDGSVVQTFVAFPQEISVKKPTKGNKKESPASLEMPADSGSFKLQKDAQYAHPQDLLDRAKSSITDDGHIELNVEAGELLRRIAGKSNLFFALTHKKGTLIQLARKIDRKLDEFRKAGYSDAEIKVLTDLADQLREVAKKGAGITYIFDFSLPHETHHQMVLNALGDNVFPEESVDELSKLDVWKNPKVKQPTGQVSTFNKLYPNARGVTKAFEIAAMLDTGEIQSKDKERFLQLFAQGIRQASPEINEANFARIFQYDSTPSNARGDTETGSERQEDRSTGENDKGKLTQEEAGEEAVSRPNDGDIQRPDSGTAAETGEKVRQAVTHAEREGVVGVNEITGTARYYTVKSSDARTLRAQNKIEKIGLDAAILEASQPITDLKNADEQNVFQIETVHLLNRLADTATRNGDIPLAQLRTAQRKQIMEVIAKQGTPAGRLVQSFTQLTSKENRDTIREYVDAKRRQQGWDVPLTEEEAKALADAFDKLKAAEDRVAELERLLEKASRKPTKSQKTLLKVLFDNANAAKARLQDIGSLEMPAGDAIPLSLHGQVLSDLSDIGAAILYDGFNEEDILTPEQFEKEFNKQTKNRYAENWRQVHAESLAKLKQLRKDIATANKVAELKADNPDITPEEITKELKAEEAKQKERTKIRREHTKLANEVLGTIRKGEKGIAKDEAKKKAEQDKATEFIRTAYQVNPDVNEQVLTTAILLNRHSGLTTSDASKLLREIYPELEIKGNATEKKAAFAKINDLLAKGRKLQLDVRKAQKDQALRNRGLDPEQYKRELAEAKRERREAQSGFDELINSQSKPPATVTQKVAQLQRMAMVSAINTAANNLASGVATRGQFRVVDAIDAAIQKAAKKLKVELKDEGVTADTRFWDIVGYNKTEGGAKNWLKDLTSAHSLVLQAINDHPELFNELYGDYSSDITTDDIKGEGLIHGALDGGIYAFDKLNFANRWQEYFVRDLEVLYALQLRLGQRGINISDAHSQEDYSQLTAEDWKFAIKRARSVTYALRPEAGTVAKRVLDTMNNKYMSLPTALILPFAKFSWNAWNMTRNWMPIIAQIRAVRRVASEEGKTVKDLFNPKEYTSREMANSVFGFVMLGAMIGLTRALGDRDDWYYLKIPGTDGMGRNGSALYVDIRQHPQLAPFVYLGNKFNRLIDGKEIFNYNDPSFIAGELGEAFLSVSYRQAVDNNTGLQAISHGLASALSNTDQEKNREKAWYLLSKFAGERTGVFVSPFRPLKNVMDSIDKGGDKDLYDYPFAQGFERNLPKAIFFDAPEKKDSQGNPKKFNPYQYLKPFSLNVVDDTIAEPELPNLLRIKRKGSNFKYEQPVLPEELRERDARKERKAKLRTDADITEIMALPEFKKSTTDQLVSMIRSADPEEVEPLKKMLRQKVINARKAGTFTEAEAKRVNDLLGTQYKAKTEK